MCTELRTYKKLTIREVRPHVSGLCCPFPGTYYLCGRVTEALLAKGVPLPQKRHQGRRQPTAKNISCVATPINAACRFRCELRSNSNVKEAREIGLAGSKQEAGFTNKKTFHNAITSNSSRSPHIRRNKRSRTSIQCIVTEQAKQTKPRIRDKRTRGAVSIRVGVLENEQCI